jgi:soluble lytic murein transglycosylase-like protein
VRRASRTRLCLGGLAACGMRPRGATRISSAIRSSRSCCRRSSAAADCFVDKYESEVWYKAMEPRIARFVPLPRRARRDLDHVYCEAKRDPTLQLPPDLVLAVIEVESRFDRWAVSRAGAVGLMQVMPFWPRQLGVQNQLVRTAPNIRMGCEILRYYLRAEHHELDARARALQRQHRAPLATAA